MKATHTYYLFTLLFRFGIGATATLYVPWLFEIGLTFSQVALLNAIFWTSVILLEIPTGMLADGRGRGWSIKIGAFIYGFGALYYSQVTGFSGAVFAEVILAIGFTFLSGATVAWIVDAPDRDDDLQSIQANVNTISGVTTVAATLIAVRLTVFLGAMVYWYMLAVFCLLAAALAWHSMQGREPEHPMKEFEALKYSVAHLRASKDLRWAVAAQAVTGLFGTFNMYWALLMLMYVNKIELGWIWALMYLSMAASGPLVSSRWGHKIGPAFGITISIALAGIPMMFFGLTTPVVSWLVLIAIHEFARGTFRPYLDTFINDRIASGYRATFGSLASFIGSIGMVVTLLGASAYMAFYESNAETIIQLWTITGALLVLSSVLLYIFRPNLKPRTR